MGNFNIIIAGKTLSYKYGNMLSVLNLTLDGPEHQSGKNHYTRLLHLNKDFCGEIQIKRRSRWTGDTNYRLTTVKGRSQRLSLTVEPRPRGRSGCTGCVRPQPRPTCVRACSRWGCRCLRWVWGCVEAWINWRCCKVHPQWLDREAQSEGRF